jgi:hypothetical protein
VWVVIYCPYSNKVTKKVVNVTRVTTNHDQSQSRSPSASRSTNTMVDVLLIAKDHAGETGSMRIAASLLSASSSVWRERLLDATPEDGECVRSEENCSLFEVECWVGLCTLMSPKPTMPELLRRGNICDAKE